MAVTAFEVVVAYLIADFMTGIYHFATDRGYNIRRQVHIFQQHHDSIERMTLDFRPIIFGLPVLIMAVYLESIFLSTLAGSVVFCQLPHYYAHNPGKWPVRLLQRCWLILPPNHHQKHHSGDFDKNYCTMSGWNNWWLNYILSRFQPSK